MSRRNQQNKFSVNNALAIINKECNEIYKKQLPGEKEVNKFFLTGRLIVESSLRVILYRSNPRFDPSREMLGNLLTHMRAIPEFNTDFISFLHQAKKWGNIDAHSINYNRRFNSFRNDLYDYLEWFFKSLLKHDLPNVLTIWYVDNFPDSITDNKQRGYIEIKNKERIDEKLTPKENEQIRPIVEETVETEDEEEEEIGEEEMEELRATFKKSLEETKELETQLALTVAEREELEEFIAVTEALTQLSNKTRKSDGSTGKEYRAIFALVPDGKIKYAKGERTMAEIISYEYLTAKTEGDNLASIKAVDAALEPFQEFLRKKIDQLRFGKEEKIEDVIVKVKEKIKTIPLVKIREKINDIEVGDPKNKERLEYILDLSTEEVLDLLYVWEEWIDSPKDYIRDLANSTFKILHEGIKKVEEDKSDAGKNKNIDKPKLL
jgi:hypothetical protein